MARVDMVIRCSNGNYRLSIMTQSGLDFTCRGVDLVYWYHRLQVLEQIEFSYLGELRWWKPRISIAFILTINYLERIVLSIKLSHEPCATIRHVEFRRFFDARTYMPAAQTY